MAAPLYAGPRGVLTGVAALRRHGAVAAPAATVVVVIPEDVQREDAGSPTGSGPPRRTSCTRWSSGPDCRCRCSIRGCSSARTSWRCPTAGGRTRELSAQGPCRPG